MILSIDESIRVLKSEILAQDWRLPKKRVEPLEAALTCLKNRYTTRKNTLAILTMAESVVKYLKKQDKPSSPEFIDFLKEAMAHIVTLYEDSKYDPEKEAQIFKRVYSRFAVLKKTLRKPAKTAASPRKKSRAQTGAAPAENRASAPPPNPHPVSPAPASVQEPAAQEAMPAPPRPAPKEDAEAAVVDEDYAPHVHELRIGEVSVAVPAENIALVRPLSKQKKALYMKNSHIPLKDLTRFMRSLAKELQGELAKIKDSKLKKLILPLMVPRGLDLPHLPDENATDLVILTTGLWHGIIFCSGVEVEAKTMVKFKKARNGDIAGIGSLEGGGEIQLLDAASILSREGFLAMI